MIFSFFGVFLVVCFSSSSLFFPSEERIQVFYKKDARDCTTTPPHNLPYTTALSEGSTKRTEKPVERREINDDFEHPTRFIRMRCGEQ